MFAPFRNANSSTCQRRLEELARVDPKLFIWRKLTSRVHLGTQGKQFEEFRDGTVKQAKFLE